MLECHGSGHGRVKCGVLYFSIFVCSVLYFAWGCPSKSIGFRKKGLILQFKGGQFRIFLTFKSSF